jgi:ElaB/YqjD/DUF883 family membrane-anchored ribosome-binding protein
MANTVQNAREIASQAAERAKDTTSAMADKAKDVASSAMDRTRDMASRAGQKADDMAGRAGSAMESAAGTVREHAPQSGVLGSAAAKVADTLESGGRYLREEGVSGLAEDLTDLIRRNPIPALLLGLGVGFLLGRALGSRNG